MAKELALYISIIAIVLAGISLFVDWQQFEFTQSANSPPDIVGCITSFSYEKGSESGGWIIPVGEVGFDLVNRGNTEATIHRVDVHPYGLRENGEKSSMWFTLETQAVVPGNGITTVEKFSFEDTQTQGSFWVEEFEGVWIQAFWPNGNGPQIACKPDVVSAQDGDWFCGYPNAPGGGFLGENACR